MDYHAIHEHDVEGFGSPLAHRVVTVSAADADAALLSQSSAASSTASGPVSAARLVPTGLATLDAILAGQPDRKDKQQPAADAGIQQTSDPAGQSSQQRRRRSNTGLRRGQLTEIWGPPGVGKTAFGMQLVANALRDGSSAVWIDCFHLLCRDRLTAIVDAQAGDGSGKSLADGFTHYACSSLPHFLAMFCPPTAAAELPPGTALVVIDSLSALINHALPRMTSRKATPLMANGKRGPAAHEKRAQVLQCIVAALERLGEIRHVAVVVLTQCASRVQAERGGAALVPALHAVVWDRGISTRLVLFRDWAWQDGESVGGRFAGVQKCNGRAGDMALSHVVAFSIAEGGLEEQHYSAVPPRTVGKRKRDNEDDYGWGDEDTMPNMPPQWQGSEDLLLRHGYDDEEKGEEEEEEVEEEVVEDEENVKEVEEENVEGEEEGNPVTDGKAQDTGPSHRPRRSRSVADSEDDSDI